MKLHLLILSAILTIGCGGSDEPYTNANANFNRAAKTPTKEGTPQIDKEKEARILQKIQEFVSVNYAEWTLKGTADLATSPIELHIVKGADEKIVKVNYKELNDLNGQPYIVISEFSQSDLTNTNTNAIETKSEVNTNTNNNVNQ